jgi:predicted RNase H-like HicB family nuclease
MEDDAYWATVAEFPGVFATGDNVDELRASLEEGISLVLATADGQPAEVKLAPLRDIRAGAQTKSELVYAV